MAESEVMGVQPCKSISRSEEQFSAKLRIALSVTRLRLLSLSCAEVSSEKEAQWGIDLPFSADDNSQPLQRATRL